MMGKIFRLLAIVATAMTAIALLLSCKADIVIPPDPGIEGQYIGRLIVIANYNAGGVPPDTSIQNVRVQFRASNNTFSYKDTLLNGAPVEFCNASGEYSFIESKVKIVPKEISRDNVCDPNKVPTSVDENTTPVTIVGFDFRTPGTAPNDSLILSQTWLAKF